MAARRYIIPTIQATADAQALIGKPLDEVFEETEWLRGYCRRPTGRKKLNPYRQPESVSTPPAENSGRAERAGQQ